LEGPWPDLSVRAQGVLKTAAHAAKDLGEYRNALFHGWMMPFGEITSFVSNAAFFGELRKRSSNTAYIDENLLDMAISSAWVLCGTTGLALHADLNNELEEREGEVSRARGMASKLRYLREAVNHEKY
jgi:hypothetical protein